MSTRRAALPPRTHIAIADAVTTALADTSKDDQKSLPAKVREALDYLAEVAQVVNLVRTEQLARLGDYVDELTDVLGAEATEILLSSHVMARLLADVEAGHVKPVATAAKKAPAPRPTPQRTGKKAIATPKPSAEEDKSSSDTSPELDGPAPTPGTADLGHKNSEVTEKHYVKRAKETADAKQPEPQDVAEDAAEDVGPDDPARDTDFGQAPDDDF